MNPSCGSPSAHASYESLWLQPLTYEYYECLLRQPLHLCIL